MKQGLSSLGLSSRREQLGISLQSVAATTRISLRWLRAIEFGDYKQLPGGVYNTSYIREYARAVQFDEAELLAHYQAATNPPAPAEPLRSHPRWRTGY